MHRRPSGTAARSLPGSHNQIKIGAIIMHRRPSGMAAPSLPGSHNQIKIGRAIVVFGRMAPSLPETSISSVTNSPIEEGSIGSSTNDGSLMRDGSSTNGNSMHDGSSMRDGSSTSDGSSMRGNSMRDGSSTNDGSSMRGGSSLNGLADLDLEGDASNYQAVIGA